MTAIRLFTNENFNTKLCSSHTIGNSCAFRNTSCLILQALEKLKLKDPEWDISKYKKECDNQNIGCWLYRGMSDLNIKKELESNSNTKLNRLKSNRNVLNNFYDSNEDYCKIRSTFSSVTQDFRVAYNFAIPRDTKHGVILQINYKNLFGDRRLLFGDIGWISEHGGEVEILFGPSMFDIYGIDYPRELQRYQRQCPLVNTVSNWEIVLAGAEIVSMCKICKIRKYIRNNGKSIRNGIPSNYGSEIYGCLSPQERKIKQSIARALRRVHVGNAQELEENVEKYFGLLQEQNCVNMSVIGGLTNQELKDVGIQTVGERNVLRAEFAKLNKRSFVDLIDQCIRRGT